MHNTWIYSALISPTAIVDGERIEAIVSRFGYSFRNPETGLIHIERLTLETLEGEQTNLASIKSLTPELTKPGTQGVIWKGDKGDIDFMLWFDLAGTRYAQDVKTNRRLDTPFYGVVSIFVGDHLVRANSPARIEVSRDARLMFVELCSDLGATYGYSIDEYSTPNFADRIRTHDDTHHLRKPSVLFWENYFSSAYFNAIGSSPFEKLGAKIQEVGSGYLVSLFDYPWNVQLPALESINRAWHQLTG